MKKLDVVLLFGILCVAAGLRLWAPWDDVFSGARVNFLETDAWYHVRLIENQVRHFPHHVTMDPYAALDGQFVAVAPLFDAVVSTAVFVTRGRNAPTAYLERVAALAPPIMGVLAVVAVWALATLAFDRRAGLVAALLAAILPGHFLDRTLVGFVDHHALEVLLAFSTLAALVWALRSRQEALSRQEAPSRLDMPSRQEAPSRQAVPSRLVSVFLPSVAAGLLLGLYLLTWSSGAFLVAILAVWVVSTPFIGDSKSVGAAARSTAIAAAVALFIVLLLQDPALFRDNTQLASLAVLMITAAILGVVVRTGVNLRSVSSVLSAVAPRALADRSAALVFVSVSSVAVVAVWVWAADLLPQISIDLNRFRPDATRMAVLEARPLFLYTGNWTWLQPWTFFRSGFYVGAAALLALAISVSRSRRLDHLLIAVFTAVAFVATLGQNRFGYYLVPATAGVIGWLSSRVLDWGGLPDAGHQPPKRGRRMSLQRGLAIIFVAGVVVAPNIAPAALTTTRAGGMPDYWAAAMAWLRAETPMPFDTDDFYFSRYRDRTASARYTIMNWWDQGYWIVQAAHRVPVSNPTQANAPSSARFYTATDEAAALRLLSAERARFVLVDWELPFRETSAGALGGRFQNLADWAGTPTSTFYQLCYSRARDDEAWQPLWLFREAYYQTMIYRLMVLGGAAADPENNTWVVQTQDRVDANGRQFCEVTASQRYRMPDEARAAVSAHGVDFRAVGLSPWQPAFDVPAITGLRIAQEFREPSQAPDETPMVRIFEVSR